MNTKRFEHLEILLKSGLMSKGNADRCVRICYDAAKIIHYREHRLRKTQLKMNEISSALLLVHFHHTTAYHFDAVAELAVNFCSCDEAKALKYYEQYVIGTVTDKFGRSILIDEDGMRSLYKEKSSGKHIVASENYEEFRGKRLPWIRHTLNNSRAIYVVEEIVQGKFRRTYIYTAIASIPLNPKPSVSHYIVVVSEDGNKNLKFVTAYAIDQVNRFLKCIEPGKPFGEQ